MANHPEDYPQDQSASLPVEQQAAEQPTRRRGAAIGNQYAKGHGAPKGNRNRMTHGLHAWATTGRLPKGCAHKRKQLGWMHAELTKAAQDVVGELGPYHLALIQSSIRHEGRAMLLQRLLLSEADLSLSDKLTILRDISAATDSRDKCIERLGLKVQSQRDPWEALNTPSRIIDVYDDAGGPQSDPGDPGVIDQNASDAVSGDVEAQS